MAVEQVINKNLDRFRFFASAFPYFNEDAERRIIVVQDFVVCGT